MDRALILSELRTVDIVVASIYTGRGIPETLKIVKPHIFAKVGARNRIQVLGMTGRASMIPIETRGLNTIIILFKEGNHE